MTPLPPPPPPGTKTLTADGTARATDSIRLFSTRSSAGSSVIGSAACDGLHNNIAMPSENRLQRLSVLALIIISIGLKVQR